jgi:poly(3-hydroxybutyrate) depolymerase
VEDGAGGPLPEIPGWLDRWAERNGCGAKTVEDVSEKVEHSSWTCRGVDGALQHYKVIGQGHSWPKEDAGLDSSKVIMDFFRAHTKP